VATHPMDTTEGATMGETGVRGAPPPAIPWMNTAGTASGTCAGIRRARPTGTAWTTDPSSPTGPTTSPIVGTAGTTGGTRAGTAGAPGRRCGFTSEAAVGSDGAGTAPSRIRGDGTGPASGTGAVGIGTPGADGTDRPPGAHGRRHVWYTPEVVAWPGSIGRRSSPAADQRTRRPPQRAEPPRSVHVPRLRLRLR